MSLSQRGQLRASLVNAGGPLHQVFRGITNEWRPDFSAGTSQLDVSENDLMEHELGKILEYLFSNATSNQEPTTTNWLVPGAVNPSCSEQLLTAFCVVINQFFKPCVPVIPQQLVGGAGCSLLLEAVARVVCDPQDVILTPAPMWPVFSFLFAKAEVQLSVVIPDSSTNKQNDVVKELESLLHWTTDTAQLWQHHFESLLAAGKQPRAILISNPQNPLGRCYPRSFLVGILEFCQKNDLFLISDEVFALSQHGEAEVSHFHSILSIDLSTEANCDPSRIIMLWSVSKDFGATGSRAAVAVLPQSSANTNIKPAVLSFGQSLRIASLSDGFFRSLFASGPSSINDQSVFTVAENEKEPPLSLLSLFVRENGRRLESAKQVLKRWCLTHELPYLEANSGHFLMIYFGQYISRRETASDGLEGLEKVFNAHLLSHGVALLPGLATRCPRPGWFRVTFTRNEQYMQTALSRLDHALRDW